MSFTYEDKVVDSLFVDKIWHTRATSSGVYTASLDGNWDIIISKTAGGVTVLVNGVGKGAAEVPYTAGTEYLGIALKPGVFLRDLKGKDIVDSQHVLTKGDISYVQIGGSLFKIPEFGTAEAFVDELVEKGVLLVNKVVSSFSEGEAKGASDRSLRRHVAQTTGLSPYFFHQIQRAQQAVQLLQGGMSIAQAAAEAGYTDQAHMTKAVKQLIGRTPAQIVAKH
jgi:hypothetical protein